MQRVLWGAALFCGVQVFSAAPVLAHSDGEVIYEGDSFRVTLEDSDSEAMRKEEEARLARIARCEDMADHAQRHSNLEKVSECVDVIWHSHTDVGYKRLIALGKRVVELDPSDYEMTTTVAWLYYSKWVMWKNGNENVGPEDEHAMEKALAYLDAQSKHPENEFNSSYHMAAAHLLAPAAKVHDGGLFPTVIRYYLKAEVFSDDPSVKLRARLSIAHAYRHSGKCERAEAWYKKALSIDPENRAAHTSMKNLDKCRADSGKQLVMN